VPRSPPPLASGFAHNSSEKTGSSYPHAFPAAGSAQKRDGKFSVLVFVTSSVDALVKACLVVTPTHHPSPPFPQVFWHLPRPGLSLNACFVLFPGGAVSPEPNKRKKRARVENNVHPDSPKKDAVPAQPAAPQPSHNTAPPHAPQNMGSGMPPRMPPYPGQIAPPFAPPAGPGPNYWQPQGT
jgi:hypothetical protein